jgi:hypothetical protein
MRPLLLEIKQDDILSEILTEGNQQPDDDVTLQDNTTPEMVKMSLQSWIM